MATSPSRVLLLVGLLAIGLAAIGAWLLNVPLVAVAVGVVLSLLGVFLWLSRHVVAGKRSGVGAQDEKSRPQ